MATPQQRSAAARKAVNTSWARTPVRRERTRKGTEASPFSLAYWEAKVRAEGVVCEAEIPLAAENYRIAWQQGNAKKSAASRAKNKAARLAGRSA